LGCVNKRVAFGKPPGLTDLRTIPAMGGLLIFDTAGGRAVTVLKVIGWFAFMAGIVGVGAAVLYSLDWAKNNLIDPYRWWIAAAELAFLALAYIAGSHSLTIAFTVALVATVLYIFFTSADR
jgi:hypothetical protein